jgi:hypothetical protein
MVGTTRFELATSPTPKQDFTQSQQLSHTNQSAKQLKRTHRKAYCSQIVSGVVPTRHERQIDNAARTATRGYCVANLAGMKFHRPTWSSRSSIKDTWRRQPSRSRLIQRSQPSRRRPVGRGVAQPCSQSTRLYSASRCVLPKCVPD